MRNWKNNTEKKRKFSKLPWRTALLCSPKLLQKDHLIRANFGGKCTEKAKMKRNGKSPNPHEYLLRHLLENFSRNNIKFSVISLKKEQHMDVMASFIAIPSSTKDECTAWNLFRFNKFSSLSNPHKAPAIRVSDWLDPSNRKILDLASASNLLPNYLNLRKVWTPFKDF